MKKNIPIRFIALVLVVALPFILQAQWLPQKNYPKNYFGWPVNAIKAIVANFGELRPNHYHMGLDCRTEQVQNKQVLAAADGYIAKVKIEPWGFGRAIYINHPNGLTTLYAHLNNFKPELEQYVRQQQYRLQKMAGVIRYSGKYVPGKKGEFIAYSGTTGGSQGPHVLLK
ncbi:MAG: M23 family metallopeptidase [Niastella sp.]|nr:M23 family metallopeptidase [Niastella sp.]